MATLAEQWRMPDLDFGWITQYIDRGTPIKLRPGQKVCIVARRHNRQRSAYLAQGVTVYVNAGNPDPDVPADKRAMINAMEGVYGAMGGGDFRNWNLDQLESVVASLIPTNYVAFLTEELGEKLNHQTRGDGRDYGAGPNNGVPLDVWNRSAQAERVSKVVGQRVAGFYGGYGGHNNTVMLYHTDFNMLKNALKSDEAAYNTMKAYPIFDDGAFRKDEYEFRNVCVKAYGGGDPDKDRQLNGVLTGVLITKRALRFKGSNKRVGVIFFPGYEEPSVSGRNYHIRYRRRVPATGGYVYRSTFPLWSLGYQVFSAFFVSKENADSFNWESANSYGDDPNKPVGVTEEGTTYEGPAVERLNGTLQYSTQPAGYPANPQSFYDIPMIGGNLYTFCVDWTGWDLEPAPHKTTENPTYSVIGDPDEYVAICYQLRRGYCYRKVTGNRAVVVYQSQKPAGEFERVTADLGNGQTWSFIAPGKVTVAFRLNV